MLENIRGFRASFFHFLADPINGIDTSYQYIEDGLLITKQGKVEAIGEYSELASKYSKLEITDYQGKLIVPGFIDTHIHYPQTEMTAAYGEQLLSWLEQYTYPTEIKFKNFDYAKNVAEIFINELLRNGTTTALVFPTVHPESVDALFEVALEKNMRVVCGKVMMDRNAHEDLLDTAESSYEDSKRLIEKWHKKDRLLYAITPRFAPTSTPEQLQAAKKLKEEYPDTYLHTHLAENHSEIDWVKHLFPESDSYLGVYHDNGLTGERSVFAHSIHLDDHDFSCLQKTGSAVSFCPSSNLFLGSGFFKLAQAEKHKIRMGLGTDIGAGTSFSMISTMGEAYKVTQMEKTYSELSGGEACALLDPWKAFYLATLGGAKALYLEDKLGNFEKGKEADFVVLNPTSTPFMKFRMESSKNLFDKLFALMILGNVELIEDTYILGEKA